jgi:hypothetical protein
MSVEHRVTIQTADFGAAPETAVVRLASLLADHWAVYLDTRTASGAELRLIAHDRKGVGSAEAAIDEALTQPELRGWTRVSD